ncbi:MAG: hypothetical protein Fur0025_39830 [Oscillatoriaceae cyanobacterium]
MKLKIQNYLKLLANIRQRWIKFLALALTVCVATTSLVVFQPSKAVAADTVILTYFRQELPIPMAELQSFANGGKPSRVIRFLTGVANIEQDDFRTILTQEIPANLKIMDKSLNFILGELALYEIGQAIHTQTRQGNIEALRSSLILAASDNGKLSMLEIFQKYPARRLYIDARRLNKAYGQVSFLVDGAQEAIMFIRESVADIIC